MTRQGALGSRMDTLEGKGLIQRLADATDRRRVFHDVTALRVENSHQNGG